MLTFFFPIEYPYEATFAVLVLIGAEQASSVAGACIPRLAGGTLVAVPIGIGGVVGPVLRRSF